VRLEEVAASYGPGSTLNSEAVAALREARQAARSIATLAQTLERQPNSLILGR
jgi:paraquat-inducible protein B